MLHNMHAAMGDTPCHPSAGDGDAMDSAPQLTPELLQVGKQIANLWLCGPLINNVEGSLPMLSSCVYLYLSCTQAICHKAGDPAAAARAMRSVCLDWWQACPAQYQQPLILDGLDKGTQVRHASRRADQLGDKKWCVGDDTLDGSGSGSSSGAGGLAVLQRLQRAAATLHGCGHVADMGQAAEATAATSATSSAVSTVTTISTSSRVQLPPVRLLITAPKLSTYEHQTLPSSSEQLLQHPLLVQQATDLAISLGGSTCTLVHSQESRLQAEQLLRQWMAHPRKQVHPLLASFAARAVAAGSFMQQLLMGPVCMSGDVEERSQPWWPDDRHNQQQQQQRLPQPGPCLAAAPAGPDVPGSHHSSSRSLFLRRLRSPPSTYFDDVLFAAWMGSIWLPSLLQLQHLKHLRLTLFMRQPGATGATTDGAGGSSSCSCGASRIGDGGKSNGSSSTYTYGSSVALDSPGGSAAPGTPAAPLATLGADGVTGGGNGGSGGSGGAATAPVQVLQLLLAPELWAVSPVLPPTEAPASEEGQAGAAPAATAEAGAAAAASHLARDPPWSVGIEAGGEAWTHALVAALQPFVALSQLRQLQLIVIGRGDAVAVVQQLSRCLAPQLRELHSISLQFAHASTGGVAMWGEWCGFRAQGFGGLNAMQSSNSTGGLRGCLHMSAHVYDLLTEQGVGSPWLLCLSGRQHRELCRKCVACCRRPQLLAACCSCLCLTAFAFPSLPPVVILAHVCCIPDNTTSVVTAPKHIIMLLLNQHPLCSSSWLYHVCCCRGPQLYLVPQQPQRRAGGIL